MARLLTASACAMAFAMLSFSPAAGQGRTPDGPSVDAGAFQLQTLSPKEIGAGRCALFLWNRSEQPKFILFATDKPAQATIRLDGKERRLKRSRFGGESAFGHFEHQSFSGAGVAFALDLAFDAAKPVRDGVVVKSGSLRARLPDGSEAIVPVGGMVGCEPG